ncbi:MAG: hypothetical protein KDE52_04080 [Calditrichaeota bacterium]|nr:hypothetical protein [Calditrichota bacterium]MCB0268879.1 hypothetical protein [Calditrichota bacterium]MCB0286054.1 hypothetical protein [Calditrichota bacterium]MCB0299209.1 hypothetical protein [Calditrichota bacterium]MCB9070138.1 hypothetical protein [Calditrichia bacterium]
MKKDLQEAKNPVQLSLSGKNIAILNDKVESTELVGQLLEEGAKILLSNEIPEPKSNPTLTELANRGVMMEFGGHSDIVLAAELIFVCNTVESDVQVISSAQKMGIPVLGSDEMVKMLNNQKKQRAEKEETIDISEKFLQMEDVASFAPPGLINK